MFFSLCVFAHTIKIIKNKNEREREKNYYCCCDNLCFKQNFSLSLFYIFFLDMKKKFHNKFTFLSR